MSTIFLEDNEYARPATPVSQEDTPVATASGALAIPGNLSEVIGEAAKQYDLPPSLLAGLIYQESKFDPRAVSRAGATGLAQLMPGTAREVKVSDPTDPVQSIFGGAEYLRKQIDRFGGDVTKGLAAYNAGAGNVEKAIRNSQGDAWINLLPAETRDYIQKVPAHAQRFEGGDVVTAPAKNEEFDRRVQDYVAKGSTPEDAAKNAEFDLKLQRKLAQNRANDGRDLLGLAYDPNQAAAQTKKTNAAQKTAREAVLQENWNNENPKTAALISGALSASGGLWGVVRAVTGEESKAKEVANFLTSEARKYQTEMSRTDFQDAESKADWMVTKTLENAPSIVGSMAGIFNPATAPAVLTAMAMTSGGGQYNNLINNGVDRKIATMAGIAYGVVEAVSEKLPMDIGRAALKRLSTLSLGAQASLGRQIMDRAAVMTGMPLTEGIEEVVASGGQKAIDVATGYAQEAIGGPTNFTAGLKNMSADAAWREGVNAFMGGVAGGTPHGVAIPAMAALSQAQQVKALEQDLTGFEFSQAAIDRDAINASVGITPPSLAELAPRVPTAMALAGQGASPVELADAEITPVVVPPIAGDATPVTGETAIQDVLDLENAAGLGNETQPEVLSRPPTTEELPLDQEIHSILGGTTRGEYRVTTSAGLPDTVDPSERGTRLTRGTGSVLERLVAGISGRTLGFIETADQSFDGLAITRGNHLFLNTRLTVSPVAIAFHEVTHAMRTDAPAAYNGFTQAVAGIVKTDDASLLDFAQRYNSGHYRPKLIAQRLQNGETATEILDDLVATDRTVAGRDGILEEFHADLMGDAANSKGVVRQAITRMAQTDIPALKQFLQFVDGLLSKLDGQQGFGSERYIKGDTEAEFLANLKTVREAAAEALAKFGNHTAQQQRIAKMTPAELQVMAETHPDPIAREMAQVRLSPPRKNTLDAENNVSVTVGGKPGEFGWAPTARMAAAWEDESSKAEKLATVSLPPYVAPAAYQPNLSLIGESVRKVLSTKAARDVIRDVTGADVTGVIQIQGSWELKSEPSFVLSGEMTFEQANEVSKLLGFVFAQDAAVASQPWSAETEDQIPAVLIHQSKRMSEAQVKALHDAANAAGLDYSTTVDGRGAKFLHFGDVNGYRELHAAAAEIAKAAGLSNVTKYYVRSNLNEAESYLASGVGQSLRGDRGRGGDTGPLDLFRRAVDHLVVPYAKAVGAEGYRFSADRFGKRFGLNEAEVEYLRAAIRPKSGKPLSTVPIVSGEERVETPRTNTRTKIPGVSKFDLAWALQNRTAKFGLIDPSDRSDAASKVIAEALADEVSYALDQEGGKSAVGWYDRALHEAKNRYEQVFPELRTDPDREMLFDAVLGVASQGNDVHSNALFAGRVYFLMTRQGMTLGQATQELTGTFGKQTVAIENNLLKLEALLDRNGYDAMRRFFNTRATVGELNKILRTDETLVGADGQALKIKGAAEQVVTGWMVFGPKIGSFINNLHGDYSTLTADLWFSRTWNRVLGFSFGYSPDTESAQYVKLYRAMLDEVRSGQGRDVTQMTEAEVRQLAADPRRMMAAAEEIHEKREAEYAKLRNDAVTPLRQAAKNLVENRNDTQEIPRNDSERAFQQSTIELVQRMVRRKSGITLTIADIQAVLWYHEKNMYRDQFGVGDSKAEAADYADAASRFVEAYNRGDLFYVEKPTPRFIRGERGDYLAKRSPGRVADDAPQRGAGPAGVPPTFGRSRPQSVQIRGVHYSGQILPALSTTAYGSGLKGAERDRLFDLKNSDIRARSFFYVDEGQGLFPEAGVGEQAHDVDLLNIYDIKADPLGYRKLAAGDESKMERMVMQGGFDGYYAPGIFGRQGVAIVIGRHSIPVRSLGLNYRGGEAKPQAESKPAQETGADKVEKARTLPMGMMSGADWKKMIPLVVPGADVSMLDDAKTYYKSDVVGVMRGVRMSPKRFYSQLERSFEQAPDRVFGPAKQVKAWLASNAGKLGVKQDEVQWSGINEWLDLQGKVSKAEVLSYLQQNGVQIDEVEKGEAGYNEDDPQLPKGSGLRVIEATDGADGYEVLAKNGRVIGTGETEAEAIADAYSGNPEYWEKATSTKYEQYVLPGDQNYRELLLTLPGKATDDKFRDIQRRLDSAKTPEESVAILNERSDLMAEREKMYSSAHWDEKNILAHVRFNDRTDADGNRVLFIEELQSDWGQQGKKSGFFDVKKPWEVFNPREGETVAAFASEREAMADAEARGSLFDWSYAGHEGRVPTGPFVTKTEAWLDLGLKRMIAYAVENGYDKVAFVNGQQSAERYDLSKQINTLYAGMAADGTYLIGADGKSGRDIIDQKVTKEELPGVVGKELAERIIQDVTDEDTNAEYTGLDLKVGGEGMKAFYDQIVPQRIKEVLKKLGGGKIEQIGIDYPRQKRAGRDVVQQTGFSITPEMRTKVEAGLPLFSPPRNVLGLQIGQRWDATEVTPFDQVVRKLQDKLVDTKRVVATIKEAGIDLGTKFDPYAQEVLYHGRSAKVVQDFADFELRPLLEEMQAANVSMGELENYLWALHAPERNAQIALINPNMPDGGSGLTNAEARQLLSGAPVTLANGSVLQTKTGPQMARLAARVRRIADGTLDALVAYGLEKQETVDQWRRTYPNYVPLMRDMESDDNFLGAFGLGLGTGQGFSVRGSASKQALGSKRNVVDILANLAMQRERAIVRGEKNRVALAVYGAALKAPNPEFWLPINPQAPQQKMTQVIAELVQLGLSPNDAQAIALTPKEQYLDPRTGLVSFRINPALRGRSDVLFVRVNGEDRFVMFSNDERAQNMVESLKNLDAEQLGFMMQNIASVTRWFAAVNTQYNPVFGLVNGVRDFQTAMLNLSSTPIAGQRAKVAQYGFQALRGTYVDLRNHRQGRTSTSAWAAEFEEFAKYGGMTGYRDMFQTSKARTDALAQTLKEMSLGKFKRWGVISEANPIFAWLADYNTSIENAFRVAAFKAGKESGLSPEAAAVMAKNLTVNFNKKGQVATQAGALYAFFNAAVQGTTRIAETMVEHRGSPSDWKNLRLSKAGKNIIYGGMLLGVMQGVMAALAGWDDEEPPQFQREKNFMIPVPGTDKVVSVPYPLGYHVIPNTTRIMTEFALGGFRDPGKHLSRLVGMIADAFNPIGSSANWVQTLSPTIGDPLVALGSNLDWNGRKIYKEDYNRLHPTPGWTRAKDTATPWAKAMAYGMNWASGAFNSYEKGLISPTPDQIDYLIGQVTGGVGREVSKASQFVESVATGEDVPAHKVPVLGRFYGETDGVSSQVSKMYRNLEKIGEHSDPIKRMQEAGQDVTPYLEKFPEARLTKSADKVQRRLSELNKVKADAKKRGDKEAVKRVEDRIKTTASLFNDEVARAAKP